MTYRFRKLLSILLALALLLACVPAVIAEGEDPAQPEDPTGTVQDSMPADESADTELPADAAVNKETGDPAETAGGEDQPAEDEEQPAAEDEQSPAEDEQSAPEEEQPTPAAGEPAAPAEEDLKQDSEPEQVKDPEPEQEIVSEEIVIDDELAQEETPVANTPEEEPHTPAETPAGENGAAEETELPVQETDEPEGTEEPAETEEPVETEEPGEAETPEQTEEPGEAETPEQTEEPAETEEPKEEESGEPEETEDPEDDYIKINLGSAKELVLLPGEPFMMKLEAKVWANVLFTITLEPKAADETAGTVRAWIDDREQELIPVENEDPDSKAVIYTFEKRILKDNEYIITLKSNTKISCTFSTTRLPESNKNTEDDMEEGNEGAAEESEPEVKTTDEAEPSDIIDEPEDTAEKNGMDVGTIEETADIDAETATDETESQTTIEEPEIPEIISEETEEVPEDTTEETQEEITEKSDYNTEEHLEEAETAEDEPPTDEAEKTDDIEEHEEAEQDENSKEPVEQPERDAHISISWDVENPTHGCVAHFKAILIGYEDVEYTLQWQWSEDGQTWNNVEGATETTLDIVYTAQNGAYRWRILVTADEE